MSMNEREQRRDEMGKGDDSHEQSERENDKGKQIVRNLDRLTHTHSIHRYTGRQTVGNVGVNGGRDRRTTDRLKKEENEEEKKEE